MPQHLFGLGPGMSLEMSHVFEESSDEISARKFLKETEDKSLQESVELLGIHILGSEAHKARSFLLMRVLVEKRIDEIQSSDCKMFFKFFLSQMKENSLISECLSGIKLLINRLDREDKSLLTNRLVSLNIKNYSQPIRFEIYKLLEVYSELVPNEFVEMFSEEKDPRNLLVVFRIIKKTFKDLERTQECVDRLFKVLIAYHPVTFTPPKNDRFGIRRSDLKHNLFSLLTISREMTLKSVRHALDHGLDLIEFIVNERSLSEYFFYMEEIFSSLVEFVRNCTDTQMEYSALNTLSVLVVKCEKFNYSNFQLIKLIRRFISNLKISSEEIFKMKICSYLVLSESRAGDFIYVTMIGKLVEAIKESEGSDGCRSGCSEHSHSSSHLLIKNVLKTFLSGRKPREIPLKDKQVLKNFAINSCDLFSLLADKEDLQVLKEAYRREPNEQILVRILELETEDLGGFDNFKRSVGIDWLDFLGRKSLLLRTDQILEILLLVEDFGSGFSADLADWRINEIMRRVGSGYQGKLLNAHDKNGGISHAHDEKVFPLNTHEKSLINQIAYSLSLHVPYREISDSVLISRSFLLVEDVENLLNSRDFLLRYLKHYRQIFTHPLFNQILVERAIGAEIDSKVLLEILENFSHLISRNEQLNSKISKLIRESEDEVSSVMILEKSLDFVDYGEFVGFIRKCTVSPTVKSRFYAFKCIKSIINKEIFKEEIGLGLKDKKRVVREAARACQ